MTEKQYLICLYSFLPFGPLRCKLLISYFGLASKVWKANERELVKVGLKPEIAKKFINYRSNFDINSYFKKLKSLDIKCVTFEEDEYPDNLRDLGNAPLVLYIRGQFPNLTHRAVAIVGSRKMTSYGREVAYKFATELASLGVVIVSGLALGIDAVAHKGTLDVNGLTVAVLASGVDILTPLSNYNIAVEIIKRGGAVVSEYPLGTNPTKNFFPNRNRIIAGLSNVILVVEGAQKSGTFHTVSAALDYGRQVMSIPGPITSPSSEFPNYLIKNGAKVITTPRDILEELNVNLQTLTEKAVNLDVSDKKGKKLLEILTNEPLHLDEIVRISTLKVSEVSATLTVMELKGLVKNIGNGVYKKIS